ncbi:MAG: hypothetical protein N3C62_01640 [Synergistetes bacterium]|nr:hypothetical protein [Synergistota bacterium]MCX8127442.1 hypothetical protein [Synergistota bacterium]MDW8192305.1 hypothetical protein [Synergistota bacterium]
MRVEGINAWNRIEQAYRSENQITDQVRESSRNENRAMVYRGDIERPREGETYNREGERVTYVSPGKVFEAQG